MVPRGKLENRPLDLYRDTKMSEPLGIAQTARDIFNVADYNCMGMGVSKVDLRPIHAICKLLPEETNAPNEDVKDILDLLDAAIFHCLFPIRGALAEKWFDEHPIQEKERRHSAETQHKAMQLLLSIGLTKEKKVKRRF